MIDLKGHTLIYTSDAFLASGDVVTVGDLVGVAEAGALPGKPCVLTIEGVFEFISENAILQGDKVYLAPNGKATSEATKNHYLGIAMSSCMENSALSVKINIMRD